MFYPLSLFIALRYNRSHKKNGFISFITFFSVIGITLGVMALIIVMAVMAGFENELKQRILTVVPQVVISDRDKPLKNWKALQTPLEQKDHVTLAVPLTQSTGAIQTASGLQGVQIQGLYPDVAYPILEKVYYGSWSPFFENKYRVVLSALLANQLKVGIGDKVRLIVAESSSFTPTGRIPTQRTFTVAALYNTETELDAQVVFTRGEDLRRLLRFKAGEISGIRLFLDDAFIAPQVAEQLHIEFPQYKVTDWREKQGDLFAAVAMEKHMMWLMLGLIVAVAAFNIVSALVMMVSEKQAEIAILKTYGMSREQIRRIFMLQGGMNGVAGALIGGAIGLLAVFYLNPVLTSFGIQLLPGLSELPIVVNFQNIIAVIVGAMGLSFLATLYPASYAANFSPADQLRHE